MTPYEFSKLVERLRDKEPELFIPCSLAEGRRLRGNFYRQRREAFSHGELPEAANVKVHLGPDGVRFTWGSPVIREVLR